MKFTSQTKILIAALLLVAAAAAWYTLYVQGQASPKTVAVAAGPPTKPSPQPALPEKAQTVTSTSARALEILPLPFLVTAPPKETASSPAEVRERPKQALSSSSQAVKVPPNPFVPLPQVRKLLGTKPPAEKAPRPEAPPPSEQPVVLKPAEAPELVQVPVPRPPTPPSSEPVVPPETRMSLGVLPIRLQPVEKEVAPPAPQTAKAAGAAEDRGALENPLAAWAKEQKLKLVGVALGPVSVAIFATKDGYLALPVGERFPGTDIRLKAVTAERVLLAQGDYNLTLEYGGGG